MRLTFAYDSSALLLQRNMLNDIHIDKTYFCTLSCTKRKCLLTMLLCFATRSALTQGLSYSVPDGPRHFIILIDSSNSMANSYVRGVKSVEKRGALAEAERGLTKCLFDKGSALHYRRGQDLISMFDFGIDTEFPVEESVVRLSKATLGSDYIRVRHLAASNMSRNDFLNDLRPVAPRTHLSILSWALPLGLKRAGLQRGRNVQETYVILVNDAQLNDIDLAEEKANMMRHLRKSYEELLIKAENTTERNIAFMDDNGNNNPLFVMRYGNPMDPVVVTIFRAIPKTSIAFVNRIRKLNPLRSIRFEWVQKDSAMVLTAKVQTAEELASMSGRLVAEAGDRVATTKPFNLGSSAAVTFVGDLEKAQLVDTTLWVSLVVTNPLVGAQRISIPFHTVSLIPERPDIEGRRWLISFIVALAGVVSLFLLFWIYRQRNVARHFQVFLSDFPGPFTMQSVAQGGEFTLVTRGPVRAEASAFYIQLPRRVIRRWFYYRASIEWDSSVNVEGFKGLNRARVCDLPPLTHFIWRTRPSVSGAAKVIVGSVGNKGGVRLIVRFPSSKNVVLARVPPVRNAK